MKLCWVIIDKTLTKITATVYYFYYNSHYHQHYYDFHYHCKMHLYHLKILLTILFIVIWSPACFNWILSSFCRYVFFFDYIILFVFLRPVNGVSISLRTIRHILDVLFIPLSYSYSYLHFLIYTHCLYLFTLTDLYLCSLYTIIQTW